MTNGSRWDPLQDMKLWLVQRIRNRVAKQVSYQTFWRNSSRPKRAVLAQNDPQITFPCHLSYLKNYSWFRRNQLLSGSGPIQVVSVFSYSENGLWFSLVLDGNEAKSSSTRFNQNQ